MTSASWGAERATLVGGIDGVGLSGWGIGTFVLPQHVFRLNAVAFVN
jgi:hypothetical protein